MSDDKKRQVQRGYIVQSLEDVPQEIRSSHPVFVSEGGAELRLDDTEGGAKIRGHAAVFNVPTLIYGHREVVRPGAFKKTIAEGDARGLFNHDPNWLLGRRKSGTLAMAEDSVGLRYEIDPPKTDLIRDLVLEPMRRGDVSGSSFSFQAIRDPMKESEDGIPLREILEARVFDVGPVTFPAYEATDAQFRSWLGAAETPDEVMLLAAMRGAGLTDPEIRARIDAVMGLLNEDGRRDQCPTPAAIDALHRRLRAAELET